MEIRLEGQIMDGFEIHENLDFCVGCSNQGSDVTSFASGEGNW